jgi:hypothetical protein
MVMEAGDFSSPAQAVQATLAAIKQAEDECGKTDECKSGWERAKGGLEILSVFAPLPGPTKARLALEAAKGLGLGGKAKKGYAVYVGRSRQTGETRYVGITSRKISERAAEHARDTQKRGIEFREIKGLTGLSKSDARSVEQALILAYGRVQDRAGSAFGGQLLNRINAISEKNPRYAERLERGLQLLNRAGFRF